MTVYHATGIPGLSEPETVLGIGLSFGQGESEKAGYPG